MRLVSVLLRNVLSPKSRRHQSLDVDAYKSATALVCHQTSAYIKRSKVSHDFFPFFLNQKFFNTKLRRFIEKLQNYIPILWKKF